MNKKWNSPFHENGTLHKKTVVPFDHRIIMFLYNCSEPLKEMGATDIFITYADGVEKMFDETSWILFGKQILINRPLRGIRVTGKKNNQKMKVNKLNRARRRQKLRNSLKPK